MTMATRAVLGTLLTNPGIHGYQIHKSAKVGPGTLYTILARLETRGLAHSWWGDPDYPRRRCYALTEEGKELARRSQR